MMNRSGFTVAVAENSTIQYIGSVDINSKKYGCANVRFTHKATNIIYTSTKGEDAIRYMSLHDNKYLRYFKGHTGLVVSLELSPEDDSFISASTDGTIRFWDLKTPISTVSGYLLGCTEFPRGQSNGCL